MFERLFRNFENNDGHSIVDENQRTFVNQIFQKSICFPPTYERQMNFKKNEKKKKLISKFCCQRSNQLFHEVRHHY